MQSDPWVFVHTRHGFAADEIISALQKEIRRNNAENAALVAYEMFTTSPELEAVLWRRLLVISVEDVGFGNPQAAVVVNALYQMSRQMEKLQERGLFAIHAVRYLSSSTKDRSSDEMFSWIRHSVEEGGLLPTIPDYALDMHTARGSKSGRGRKYFLEEAANVSPELENRQDEYLKRLRSMLKNSPAE
ncbi:MAG: AAA family ATPase [Anaerolineaceae bacterium]